MSGINLEKGNKVNLTKPDGTPLTRVRMGLGWDVAQGGGLFDSGPIDLDASCVMLDGGKQMVDLVWFAQLNSRDGSIQHNGDNRTGAGDGDDEVINVDLPNVPANVQTLVFTVNSYTGQKFYRVDNAFCRVVDASGPSAQNAPEVCIYKLGSKGNHTGIIVAKVYRHNGAWKFAALGEVCNGRTVHDIVPDIQRVI